ncbi:GNAT family N-acetyltransferase [Candidatus Pacearchaeota archaeon]|nr:GNAT family N-acetyltransferase [Candidatus Pacearchaeota archaeon]
MIRYSVANESDAALLAKIDKTAFKEMKTWEIQKEKDFAKSLRKKDFYFVIAYHGHEPAGYIESEFDAPKEIVWIKNIYVFKKFRRNKVAKEMIQHVARHWKKKTRLLVLLTADRNLKIFQKLGFTKTMNYLVQEF